MRGEAVTLRPLTVSDFSDQYLGWLNDPEINRYLETQWEEQTRDTIEIFLEEMEKLNNIEITYQVNPKLHREKYKIVTS